MSDAEGLREAVLKLERAREHERALRVQAERVLEGVLEIAAADTVERTLAVIEGAFRKVFGVEEGFVIHFDAEGHGVAAALGAPRFAASRWHAGAALGRALSGAPVAIFDVREVPEWREQPEELLAGVVSALHVGLRVGELSALVVLVHPARGFFDRRQVKLGQRVADAAVQALERVMSAGTERRLREELERRLETIDRQRASIRALSTPIIEVWSGVLCLPIVGALDAARSAEATESVLAAIGSREARWVIVDVTGIGEIDERTADHLTRMAAAVALLGARLVLTGIRANVARALVETGAESREIATYGTLRAALMRIALRSAAR